MNKYIEAGKNRGRLEGHDVGYITGRRDALYHVIEARFGPLPSQIANRIASANHDELSALLLLAGTAASINAFYDSP